MKFVEAVRAFVATSGIEVHGLGHGTAFADIGCLLASELRAWKIRACTGSLHVDAGRKLVGAAPDVKIVACDELQRMNGGQAEKCRRELGDKLLYARTHAKFAVIRGERRTAVCLTTANLNRNSRVESWMILEDLDLAAMFEAHVDRLEQLGAEPGRGLAYYHETYHRVLGGLPPKEQSLAGLIARWR